MASTSSAEVPTRPLGLGRVVGYGVGDFAFNLFFTFSSLFLLYFYTDVLGLPASTAGLIIMAALVWEGVTDPVMGIVANRTRSRWGRYRPYLLLGAVPLALSFVAMFVPTGLTGGMLAAYALATHLLFRTLYTVVNIPYIALSAQMTSDSLARGQLAGARMMFAILCGLALAAASLPLVGIFGGGTRGFFGLSAVLATLAVAILMLCFASTREAVADAEAHPSLGDMSHAVRSNGPFLLLLGATVLGSVGYTMSGKSLLYYMKYHAGSEAAMTTGLTVSLAAAALAMVPWMMVTRRTSKRVVWLSGVAITSVVSLSIYLLAPKAGPLLFALLALCGVGNAAFVLTFWSMLPDTVEYGEWKTGTRAEGAVFGFVIFSQKIAGRRHRPARHPAGRDRLFAQQDADARDAARHPRPADARPRGGRARLVLPAGPANARAAGAGDRAEKAEAGLGAAEHMSLCGPPRLGGRPYQSPCGQGDC